MTSSKLTSWLWISVGSCIRAAAQDALERTHQPAFGAGQVEADRLAAEMGAAVLGIEEDRGRDRDRRAFEQQRAAPARPAPTQAACGIRRPEVDPDRGPRAWLKIRGAAPGTGSRRGCSALSVSSIIRRSMPMPQPPVGGMPYSSARMKSAS